MSAVVVQMTSEDAERLAVTSMAWGGDWATMAPRWEYVKTQGNTVSFEWARAYWLEPGATALILFTSFIAAHGFEYEVLWDHDGTYVVLTDWVGE
jgi:hypothetical protein